MYDKDLDNLIGVTDLSEVLVATMNEHDLVISDSEVDQIIEATFKEADTAIPGKISFQEYEKIVTNKAGALSHLSLNISSMIEEYSTISKE